MPPEESPEISSEKTAQLSHGSESCRKSEIVRRKKMALLSHSLSFLFLDQFQKFFVGQIGLFQNFSNESAFQITAVDRHARRQFFDRMPHVIMAAFLSV